MIRQSLKVERFDVRHRDGGGKSGYFRQVGARAHIDEDAVAAQAEAKGVHCFVEPVVDVPDEAAGLVLEIFAARIAGLLDPDRAVAITIAIGAAKAGDIVLIAGKGHEKVQVLRDGAVPFDDVAVARTVLRELAR